MPDSARGGGAGGSKGGKTPRGATPGTARTNGSATPRGGAAAEAPAVRTIMPENAVMATPRDLERLLTRKTYAEDPYNEGGGSPPLRHHANSAKELNVVLNNFKKKSQR